MKTSTVAAKLFCETIQLVNASECQTSHVDDVLSIHIIKYTYDEAVSSLIFYSYVCIDLPYHAIKYVLSIISSLLKNYELRALTKGV